MLHLLHCSKRRRHPRRTPQGRRWPGNRPGRPDRNLIFARHRRKNNKKGLVSLSEKKAAIQAQAK